MPTQQMFLGAGGKPYEGMEVQLLGWTSGSSLPKCTAFLPDNGETDEVTGNDIISAQVGQQGTGGPNSKMDGHYVGGGSGQLDPYRNTTFSQPDSSPWMCTFWYKRDDNTGMTNNYRLMDFNNAGGGTCISWETNGWYYQFRHGLINGMELIATGGNIHDGNWHHIAVGAAGNSGLQTPKVYFNKTEITSHVSNSRSSSSSSGIIIMSGYGGSPGNQSTKVYMANWRMWDDLLTANEVASVYDKELG